MSNNGNGDGSVYRRLILDLSVSAGAFRLWHYLRDRASAKNASQCWVSQRTIAREIHCNRDSLPRWIKELEDAFYLRTRLVGQNHYTEYTVLDGEGRPVFETFRGPEIGATRWPLKPATVAPKQGPPRGPENGALSKPIEVNPLSKGKGPPEFAPVQVGLYLREYEAMLEHAKAALRAARSDPKLHERVLHPDVAEACAWLRKEAQEQPSKAAENLRRAAEREAQPQNWIHGALTPDGRAVVSAWNDRIREIKDAMNGRFQ